MKNLIARTIIILLVFSMCCGDIPTAYAGTEDLDSRRRVLQQSLDSINQELDALGEESKETKEYINALDKKLSYLNEEYDTQQEDITNATNRISQIENDISKNEDDLQNLESNLPKIEEEIKALDDSFDDVYDEYCKRIRAIYVSGGSDLNRLDFLLDSDSISAMLTRYEMVRAVSRRDADLMKQIEQKSSQLITAIEELSKTKADISYAQQKLMSDKQDLKRKREELLIKEEDLAAKGVVIKAQQTEANALLKSLNDKTREYGEYRDITKVELEKIDKAIADADKRFKEQITTKPFSNKKPVTTQKPKSRYISLTYPCPSYTKITCGYGDYDGHSGCDFATDSNENQRIVASDDGTVILVQMLEYSYGHYVVIRHDRTTSKGDVVYTLYAHNNDIIVKEGQHVLKGQQIAYSGTTGNSTGPHCHFEVRVGGSNQYNAENPASYLP